MTFPYLGDIVFSGSGIQTSHLVSHLFNLQRDNQAIKFYQAIRIWLAIAGIKFKKLFQIQILVIFFLQDQGFMPSIQQVHLDLYGPNNTSEKILLDM